METDHIHFEHQTAPESTRGLFDPPEPQHEKNMSDRRRSMDPFQKTPLTPKPQKEQQEKAFVRGHQRSRSAVMLTNQSKRNFGLQTLTEEMKQPEKEEDQSVTVDSLQDMINTLKSLPPVTLKESNRNSQRKLSLSMMKPLASAAAAGSTSSSSTSGSSSGADTMQNMIQNTVQELRNIPPQDKTVRRRSRRAASMNTTLEASTAMRDAALAEAEAKLLGQQGRIMEEGPTNPRLGMPRRHTTSLKGPPPLASSSADLFSRPAGRRRYSESSGTFDPSTLIGKRTSLQQLPTLSENTELKPSRRLTFNKPLVLEDSNRSLPGSRRSSRSYDNDWRASTPVLAPFSPRTSTSFNLVPFTPTRVNFAKDDANPHQRRPLFTAHLPFSALPPLFRSRQLVRGMLRVNKRNRSDAYVTCEDLDADVYVCGSRDRNRALEGDVVAVRLVDVDRVLREKKEKEEAKVARNGGQARARMPDEEDENEIIFGGDEDVDTVKPKYCGVVVAVLERAQNQVFSGTLTLMRPNNKRAQEEQAAEEARRLAAGKDEWVPPKEAPKIVWFKATDKRVPLIAIPIEQAPNDFVENSGKYATRLFVGSIKRWPITSLHPFGALERELGPVNELDVQTMAILADNNVTDTDFSEPVKMCLPTEPVRPLETQDGGRRDYTNLRAFTMDPAGSNVLDDALTIEKISNDIYEVGVHVSDVAYFIRAHSPLDKEARARAVRVDLVHKFVPMLPVSLTENLTNLNVNEPRLTLSVVWKMTTEGKILDTWVGKSIVSSKARLTYDDVQKILEDKSVHVSQDAALRDALCQDIKTLQGITRHLREARFETGAMAQKRPELSFLFEKDGEAPTSLSIKKTLPAVHIIKELHLRANMAVAQQISSQLPEHALLRRQGPPVDYKLRDFAAYVQSYLGVAMDISSAGTIEKSIEAIEDAQLRGIVSTLFLKTLAPPKYFCTGTLDITKYAHYALNAPLFTHFTAPSRRYSDIIVHRQLETALSDEKEKRFYLDRDTVQKLAQHCNVKKDAAMVARDQSSLLFMSLHLCAKQQPPSDHITVFRDAVVVAVFEQYFDVILPDYNIQKRVHLAHLPLMHSSFDPKERALAMYWNKNISTSTGRAEKDDMFLDDEEEDIDEDALVEDILAEEEQDTEARATMSQTETRHATAQTATATENTIPKQKRQSHEYGGRSRRASVLRARLSDSTAYSTEQASQTIKALDKIKVIVIVDVLKPPPVVRVLAANPFA